MIIVLKDIIPPICPSPTKKNHHTLPGLPAYNLCGNDVRGARHQTVISKKKTKNKVCVCVL